MLLWRLWSRPDRRFVIAAIGIAAAILVPVAGTFVMQGLDVRISNEDWIVYRVDGGELPANIPADLAVRFEEQDGRTVAAYVRGNSLVEPDQSANDDTGTLRDRDRDAKTPLVPPGIPVVHPSTLAGNVPHVALLSAAIDVPGAVVAPARGPDAFENAGLEGLQSQTFVLVLASVPAVALVAVAFGDQEARQRARSAATLAALGRPQLGRRILALRFIWLMVWATAFATLMAFLLWRFGGEAFRPEDTDPIGVAFALGVPALLGGIVGLFWAMRRLGDGEARLRVPPSESDLPGARLGWLPVLVRPIALGTRLLPLLLVAGLLFGVNLGFPIAAASVPAAIAGGNDEWVIGSDGGISFGGSADARAADVMALDPAIDAIIAERLLPTLVNGEAALIRGGDLQKIAAYHGIPGIGSSGLWLGQRLADRLDIAVGDVVRVQGTDPMVQAIPVAGIYRSGSVLDDEALLDNEAAGALTGHAPGESTVLRMRPDTDEARDALARSRAVIQVLDVRYAGTPTTGEPLAIMIDVANLGAAGGTREMPVRINGLVQTVAVATLGPYGRATVAAEVIVPIGPFNLEVNPTIGLRPTAADVDISAPRIVFLPDTIPVRVDGEGAVRLRNATSVVDEATLIDGEATLNATHPGRHYVTFGETSRRVIVSPDAYRNHTTFEIDGMWTTPYQPQPGTRAVLHIGVTNVGATGEHFVNVTLRDDLTVQAYATLISGQSRVIDVSFIRDRNTTALLADGQALAFEPIRTTVIKVGAEKSATVQAKVADRVLGDAQTAMMGLAAISLVSILSVVYLGTERTLHGRAHIPKVLHALGVPPGQVRYRAAWEAALLAGLAFAIAASVAKGIFVALGAIGWPLPFAHALPDPIGLLFVTQAGTAFAGAAALAAYMAAGRILGAYSTESD